jgi:hypothetical protein
MERCNKYGDYKCVIDIVVITAWEDQGLGITEL